MAFLVLILVLSICACGGQPAAAKKAESGAASETEAAEEQKDGLVIKNGENEITVAWHEIDREQFEGDLVNGKGGNFHGRYGGAELRTLLGENGIEVSENSVISVTAEDN